MVLYLVFIFVCTVLVIFFFNEKTAYELRISDWSSDVCSSDLDQALDIVASETRRITGKYGQDALWLTGKPSDNPHYHNMFGVAGGFTTDWGTLSTGAWEETAGMLGVYTGDRKSTRLNSSH